MVARHYATREEGERARALLAQRVSPYTKGDFGVIYEADSGFVMAVVDEAYESDLRREWARLGGVHVTLDEHDHARALARRKKGRASPTPIGPYEPTLSLMSTDGERYDLTGFVQALGAALATLSSEQRAIVAQIAEKAQQAEDAGETAEAIAQELAGVDPGLGTVLKGHGASALSARALGILLALILAVVTGVTSGASTAVTQHLLSDEPAKTVVNVQPGGTNVQIESGGKAEVQAGASAEELGRIRKALDAQLQQIEAMKDFVEAQRQAAKARRLARVPRKPPPPPRKAKGARKRKP